MEKLVIVVPVYKPEPSLLEKASWEQLWKIGGSFPICLVTPEGMDVEWYKKSVDCSSNLSVKTFPEYYFKDLVSYSKLLLHPRFYSAFDEYEYMLIHQLDAFLFKNDLLDWCQKGYDYIGAPFFFYYTTIGSKAKYGGVGNGGFSLRKISTLLKVITGFHLVYSWGQMVEESSSYNWTGKLKHRMMYLFGFIGLFNTTHYRFSTFNGYEDYFWGYFAGPKLKWFKLPGYETALQFSFEYNCEKLFRDNDYQLPTGCHAWWKTDKNFWLPHFKELGIEIS